MFPPPQSAQERPFWQEMLLPQQIDPAVAQLPSGQDTGWDEGQGGGHWLAGAHHPRRGQQMVFCGQHSPLQATLHSQTEPIPISSGQQ
jgi:hypothetical protein